MGIPGSQEVAAAGSSAPSQVRAGRAGSVAGPGPEACRAPGEQMGGTALGLEGPRATGSAPRSRPRLPSSPLRSVPSCPAPDRVERSTRWRLCSPLSGPSRGAPWCGARARVRRPTKNSRDPSIFGSPDPGADARVPPCPAPRRAALNGDGRG